MIIYFDENMPKHLAHGFQIIQKPEGLKTGLEIEVQFLPDKYDYACKDIDWIPQVGAEKSCVITQDLNISKRKNELELYRKNGVGIFFLRGPSKKQGLSIWEMTQALAKHWTEITQIAAQDNRPFGYTFSLKGKMKKVQ